MTLPRVALLPTRQQAWRKLIRAEQFQIIPRYGFDASEQGVEDMLEEFQKWKEDSDVYVNEVSIKEALFGPAKTGHAQRCESTAPSCLHKSDTKEFVMRLFRAQLIAFSHPAVQKSVAYFQGKARTAHASDGYYHLPGRAAIALQIHQMMLPRFGFERSRAGVQEMLIHCSKYLHDPEAARLFDDINCKLGMSPTACQRFRQVTASLAPVSCEG